MPKSAALDRQHVIDAVANHGHAVALLLQRFDDGHLLFRRHSAKNAASADQLTRVDCMGQFIAGDDGIMSKRQMELGHGCAYRFGIVAGDDLERDSLGVQSFQHLSRLGPQFVAETD